MAANFLCKAEPLLPYKERMIDGSESPNARGSFLFEGRVSMKSVVVTFLINLLPLKGHSITFTRGAPLLSSPYLNCILYF